MQGKLLSRLRIHLNSVYIKLVLVMFAILIPLMGLLISSNSYAIHVIRSQVSESYQRQTAFYIREIDNSLAEIELYLSNIAVNNSDFEILQNTRTDTDPYTLAYIRFNREVAQALSLYPLVNSFFYYNTAQNHYSTISASSESYEVKDQVRNYMEEIAHFSDPYTFDSRSSWTPVNFSGEPYLLRVLESQNNYIGVWIKASRLLPSSELQAPDASTVFAYMNEDGTSIVSNGEMPFETLDSQALSAGYTAGTPQGKYTIVGASSQSGSFFLVGIIPDKIILSNLPILSTVFRTLSFALFFIVPFSVLVLRKIFHKPFNTMTSSMHRIQKGNLEERICTDYMSDEFRTVSCIFNEMMDHIRDLKIKLYEDEINRQNETLLYLQMQVKPHFYLNSLNMIYTLARNNNAELIKTLSMRLIRHFRYMFNESIFVLLSDELEHIRNYLHIQELRIPGVFCYELEVDAALESTCIPYLLIQNFVENSIKYAITMDEMAILRILIHPSDELDEVFTIQILDNGPGFSEEVLDKIRNGELIKDRDRKHLGIWNCCRRIQLLYHGDARIKFDNLKPHGAQIKITLPVMLPEDLVGNESPIGGDHESVAC